MGTIDGGANKNANAVTMMAVSWASIHACMHACIYTRIYRFDRANTCKERERVSHEQCRHCVMFVLNHVRHAWSHWTKRLAYLLGSSGGLGKVVKLDTLCFRLSSASFPTRDAFFSRRSFLSKVSTSTNCLRCSSSRVSSFTFSSSPAIVLSLSSRDFSSSFILLLWSPGFGE